MEGIGEYARATPDAPALLFSGRPLDFAALEDRSRKLAGALASSGIGRGDRIAVLASNRPEIIEVCSAALRAAVVPVPVNALLTPPEILYVLEDSGARWILADRPVEPVSTLERVITFGDAYERLLFESDPGPLPDVTRGRPMHYTSGTTGKPKGVWVEPHSRERAERISESFRSSWGMSPEDVHLVCSPLSHSAPLRYALRTLEAGGTVVVQERFEAAETLAAIELFGVTTTFMVPTHLERIVQLRNPARHDLSSIRMLIHAGAPVRPETKGRVMELFPRGTVWEFYGATEGAATRISPEEWKRKPGSVGRPNPGAEILILDPDHRRLPAGEVGEVWVRDPEAERFSYWRDEEMTQAVWADGAFTVGDIGYLDRDGYLFLVGRAHDTIISGGVNVYPQEVEAVLVLHPAVKEACVYGAPHPEWGEQVHAAVVKWPEQPLDPERLRAWARERLAGFKCPRAIVVVDELPRTPTGKLLRRALPYH